MMSEWVFVEKHLVWEYRLGDSMVTIERRPSYCDRGHFIANVFGVADIDGADSFPRYFMDLERAKLEMAEWLEWRLSGARRGVR
jgi:hypothetical protein